jgi:ligand-binding sensor domain-containing protein/signal transduction histidine kinase
LLVLAFSAPRFRAIAVFAAGEETPSERRHRWRRLDVDVLSARTAQVPLQPRQPPFGTFRIPDSGDAVAAPRARTLLLKSKSSAAELSNAIAGMSFRPVLGIALAALLPAPRPAWALDPDRPLGACTVEVWGARRGLPSSFVRDIAQTPDGYLWIAGYGGIGRYDGARIVTLPEPKPEASIFDTQNLKVDQQGTLWLISSKGLPVCVRDGVTRDCLPAGVRLPPGARLIDAHPEADGSVWLATRDQLWRFLPGPLPRLVAVATPALGRVTFVLRDRARRLWLGTDTGLYRAGEDGVVSQASAAGALVTAPVRAYYETAQGRLWLLIDGGLLRIEGEQTRTFTARDGVPYHVATRVIEDRDGNVWIGTHQGLVRLRPGRHPDGDRWVTFTTADGLPDNQVTAVFEDREGSLWVGTRSAGIAQFTDRVVVARSGPPTLREAQRVNSICQDRTGAHWFGLNQGLLRWQAPQERLYTTRDGLPSDQVLAVAPGPGGEIWVGTSRGLGRVMDGRIDVPAGMNGQVTALYVDGPGTVWLASDDRLLRFQAGRLDEVARSPHGLIRNIEPDQSGHIWIASNLGAARLVEGRLQPVALPGGEHPGRSLHRDAEGRLWLVTGDDVARLSPGPIRFLGPTVGLGGRQLFQMIDDDRGSFWISTSRGLLRLPKDRVVALANGVHTSIDPLSLETDDRRRDIIGHNTRDPGVWKDNKGRLWFATEQGALMIDPARLRVNDRPPTIRIDEAAADARPLRRGVANDLPPGPGNLAFRFSAVTLLEPHKTRHRYRLEGFEQAWVEAGARRAAHYTNIPPGRYRFHVQGSNADGVWNEAGDVIELRLRPHFYRTAWFYSTCALALVVSLGLLWRQRVRGLRRGYMTALAERSRVARELHDTLLQGMSAVGIRVRGLRRRLGREAPEVARELAAIDTLVVATLQETRDFLGELRGQNGAGDLAVALERLAGRLTAHREISCAVAVEGQAAALGDEVTGDLFRIAQEAIQNAVKHASPSRIDVKLCYQPRLAALTVADDGCGFDQATAAGPAEGHFGLLGMRERAARLGDFRLTSAPGRGTTIEVTVPIVEAGHGHV